MRRNGRKKRAEESIAGRHFFFLRAWRTAGFCVEEVVRIVHVFSLEIDGHNFTEE